MGADGGGAPGAFAPGRLVAGETPAQVLTGCAGPALCVGQVRYGRPLGWLHPEGHSRCPVLWSEVRCSARDRTRQFQLKGT